MVFKFHKIQTTGKVVQDVSIMDISLLYAKYFNILLYADISVGEYFEIVGNQIDQPVMLMSQFYENGMHTK